MEIKMCNCNNNKQDAYRIANTIFGAMIASAYWLGTVHMMFYVLAAILTAIFVLGNLNNIYDWN